MNLSNLTILPVKFDATTLTKYQELFKKCFPESNKFTPRALSWLYAENPGGYAVGFDAYDGDNIVAHYACIPTLLNIDGYTERSLLSLNTATHPDYQGIGLFTKLASATYEAAVNLGFSSVHGVANSNSTPGFIRKLGFQLVGQLDAKIGLGNLCMDFKMLSTPYFQRFWNAETLKWRCANPANQVHVCASVNRQTFLAPAFNNLISVISNLPSSVDNSISSKKILSPVHLFIGLVPKRVSNLGSYIDIPNILRPSPLNLIYLSFTRNSAVLNKDDTLFTFLDFDAF